ncbi:MAG: hypothetical protein ACR2GN_08305 [Bacteroidia bacterium]
MKLPELLTLILIMQLTVVPVIAQKAPVVKESMTSFKKTSANSLIVTIPESNVKMVEKEWKSLMKVYGGKTKGSKGLLTTDRVVINTMGTNELLVLSKMVPMNDGVELSVAFGDKGNFISSTQDRSQYTAAENLVYNFALRIAKQGAGENTSVVEKELSVLEKKQKRIEEKQKRLQTNIEKWERNIKDANRELEKKAKELEQLNISLTEKRNQLDSSRKRQQEINKLD